MPTRIEWCLNPDGTPGEVWNPVVGCSPVSAGCTNCYAARQASRGLCEQHRGLTKDGKWTGEIRFSPDALADPCRWRKPRTVFICSMSDLFHQTIPNGFILNIWRIIASCPQHTFVILTKRADRMRRWLTMWCDTASDSVADRGDGCPPMPRGPQAVRKLYKSGRAELFASMTEGWGEPPSGAAYPLYDWMEGMRWWNDVAPNVYFGVSAEDQPTADERIPDLLKCPAAHRLVSLEPLLAAVDLGKGIGRPHGADYHDAYGPCTCFRQKRLDWVIVGAETGPRRRPCKLEWVRSIAQQCKADDVPCFIKQIEMNGRLVSDPAEFPEDLRWARQVPWLIEATKR